MASEHGRGQGKMLAFAGDQIGVAFLAKDTFTKKESRKEAVHRPKPFESDF
jgi:hypothetical protein